MVTSAVRWLRRGLLAALPALFVLVSPAALVAALVAPIAAILPAAAAAQDTTPGKPEQRLRVYVREGCPHCTEAKVFLEQLAAQRPGLRIELRPVDTDPAAREELQAASRRAGLWPPGVPTFVVDGRVLVGFDDAEHTGRDLRSLLDGHPTATGEVDSTLFGHLSASRLGLPLFTLALGLLDGFNPCAMWVLLFLLSLLVRLQDRRRMALVAGTFVLASGLVYYAFMAAWLNVFLAVGFTTPVRIALGVLALVIGAFNVKDFVRPGTGPSLSIPASARPGLVARMQAVRLARSVPVMLLGVSALAVVVNFVELLCTAGLPAVYTAVLAQQGLTPGARYGYLALYIAAYMADDALMVALAVAALASGKLTAHAGAALKLVSGAVMLVLGVVLLLRPQWLV
jgi:glutaredoxin